MNWIERRIRWKAKRKELIEDICCMYLYVDYKQYFLQSNLASNDSSSCLENLERVGHGKSH